MTLQNRVTPNGAFLADPARGTLMGNRGILHDDQRQLGTARWRHKAWVCCVLSFKNRRRTLMKPRNYTELFFLDEATALAAGHRPCAECRRADYDRFRAAWGSNVKAPQMDAILHPARVRRDRTQVTHDARFGSLPDGVVITYQNQPHLIHESAIYPYTPAGYGAPTACPPTSSTVQVLTPAPTVKVIANGYSPTIQPSAL